MVNDPEGQARETPDQDSGQLSQPESTPQGTPESQPTTEEPGLGLQKEAVEPEPPEPPKPQETPDRWHGKSREEVIRMYDQAEKLLGDLGQKVGTYEQYLRQLQTQQQQIRTTGADRQPQYVPSQTTPGAIPNEYIEKAIEGDTKPLTEYVNRTVQDGVRGGLNEVMQVTQQQYQNAYQQKLAELDTVSDVEFQKVSLERGIPYQEVKKRVLDELSKDGKSYQELMQNPWKYTQADIAKGVREFYDKAVSSEENRIMDILKRKGISIEQAKQVIEAQKQAAQTGVPQGTAGNSGKAPGSEASQFTPEEEEILQRLDLG